MIAPDGVPNIFTSTHGPRGPIRPPGAPQLPPPQMGHSPGAPQMISTHPNSGQMPTPQMVQGNPQMAPGTPQMGSGTPLGSNTPQMGPGTPQMGTNVPQMASPRMASAPTRMSPGPNISQGMSIPSPQQMVMAQQRAIAPKIEPPDTMDARAMWLPKRINHCKLIILFCMFLFLHNLFF